MGQQLHKVTISGSFRKHFDQILKVKSELESSGIKVLSPITTQVVDPTMDFVYLKGEEQRSPRGLELAHLDAIKRSDTLIICDPGGYVGSSAMLEIGYAFALGKRIIFTEKPQEFILNELTFEVSLPPKSS